MDLKKLLLNDSNPIFRKEYFLFPLKEFSHKMIW